MPPFLSAAPAAAAAAAGGAGAGAAGAGAAGAAGAGAAGAGAGAAGAAGMGAGEATGFGAGGGPMPLWNPSGAMGAGAAPSLTGAGGASGAGKGTGSPIQSMGQNMMKKAQSDPMGTLQQGGELGQMMQGFMPHASGGAPQMQFSRGQPGQPLPTMSAQPSIPSLLSQHQGGSQQALQLQQLLKQLGMR